MKTPVNIRCGKIYWKTDDVLCFEIGKDIYMEVEDAKESAEKIKEIALAKGVKVPLIVDMRQLKGISKAARQFYSDDDSPQTKACATLVNSGLTRIIANLFLGLNKPKTPLKLFTAEQPAIEWLGKF